MTTLLPFDEWLEKNRAAFTVNDSAGNETVDLVSAQALYEQEKAFSYTSHMLEEVNNAAQMSESLRTSIGLLQEHSFVAHPPAEVLAQMSNTSRIIGEMAWNNLDAISEAGKAVLAMRNHSQMVGYSLFSQMEGLAKETEFTVRMIADSRVFEEAEKARQALLSSVMGTSLQMQRASEVAREAAQYQLNLRFKAQELAVGQQQMLSKILDISGITQSVTDAVYRIGKVVDDSILELARSALFINFNIPKLLEDPYLRQSVGKIRGFINHRHAQARAFKIVNWPIAPSMPDTLIDRILDEPDASKVYRKMSNHYHRNGYKHLTAMVETWEGNSIFTPKRMKIIRAALAAHCEKNYILSIPALAPQVEGILRECIMSGALVDDSGPWVPEKSFADNKLNSPNNVYKIITKGKEDKVGKEDATYSLPLMLGQWLLIDVLDNFLGMVLYSGFKVSDELTKPDHRRKTSRHTIIHGIDVNYAKPSFSLQLLLALDAISVLGKRIN